MTRNDIEKALEFCNNNSSCDGCPYEIEDIRNCSDTLKLDARACIIKQKQEIAQLKAENARLAGKLEQVLLAIDTVKEMNAMCDFDEQRKEAVKEFAKKLKEKTGTSFDYYKRFQKVVLAEQIDELLKEYE